MGYQCGIGQGIPGLDPCEPHIFCDTCGVKTNMTDKSGMPFTWFIDGKSRPKWKMTRTAEGKRIDSCRKCKVER